MARPSAVQHHPSQRLRGPAESPSLPRTLTPARGSKNVGAIAGLLAIASALVPCASTLALALVLVLVLGASPRWSAMSPEVRRPE